MSISNNFSKCNLLQLLSSRYLICFPFFYIFIITMIYRHHSCLWHQICFTLQFLETKWTKWWMGFTHLCSRCILMTSQIDECRLPAAVKKRRWTGGKKVSTQVFLKHKFLCFSNMCSNTTFPVMHHFCFSVGWFSTCFDFMFPPLLNKDAKISAQAANQPGLSASACTFISITVV